MLLSTLSYTMFSLERFFDEHVRGNLNGVGDCPPKFLRTGSFTNGGNTLHR